MQNAVDLIKATEQTEHQVKLIRGNPSGTANVNALKQGSGKNNNRFKKTPQKREVSRDLCGRCGTKDKTRLNRAKLFTVVDAKDVFWQKSLDLESSYKTTFNTPFRHYRWLRMPFSISSAPEVWQRTMHEFIEGLQGVEVIADDFIIAGFGDTKEEAYKSLEQNERFFFTTCREWNLKLNRDKVKRAQTNVRFMGHKLTAEGLKPDPAKVEAITAMPETDSVTALKCFLGMVNY